MITIWKYPIKITDIQKLILPEGSKILSIHNQFGILTLWVLVNTEAKEEERAISIVGTGRPCWCQTWSFIGTVLDDPFVWHVFAEKN